MEIEQIKKMIGYLKQFDDGEVVEVGAKETREALQELLQLKRHTNQRHTRQNK